MEQVALGEQLAARCEFYHFFPTASAYLLADTG